MAFFVADKFRENELSFTPGGYDVEIIYADKPSRIYKRVKNPQAFFRTAKKNDDSVVTYKTLQKSK